MTSHFDSLGYTTPQKCNTPTPFSTDYLTHHILCSASESAFSGEPIELDTNSTAHGSAQPNSCYLAAYGINWAVQEILYDRVNDFILKGFTAGK